MFFTHKMPVRENLLSTTIDDLVFVYIKENNGDPSYHITEPSDLARTTRKLLTEMMGAHCRAASPEIHGMLMLLKGNQRVVAMAKGSTKDQLIAHFFNMLNQFHKDEKTFTSFNEYLAEKLTNGAMIVRVSESFIALGPWIDRVAHYSTNIYKARDEMGYGGEVTDEMVLEKLTSIKL